MVQDPNSGHLKKKFRLFLINLNNTHYFVLLVYYTFSITAYNTCLFLHFEFCSQYEKAFVVSLKLLIRFFQNEAFPGNQQLKLSLN